MSNVEWYNRFIFSFSIQSSAEKLELSENKMKSGSKIKWVEWRWETERERERGMDKKLGTQKRLGTASCDISISYNLVLYEIQHVRLKFSTVAYMQQNMRTNELFKATKKQIKHCNRQIQNVYFTHENHPENFWGNTFFPVFGWLFVFFFIFESFSLSLHPFLSYHSSKSSHKSIIFMQSIGRPKYKGTNDATRWNGVESMCLNSFILVFYALNLCQSRQTKYSTIGTYTIKMCMCFNVDATCKAKPFDYSHVFIIHNDKSLSIPTFASFVNLP